MQPPTAYSPGRENSKRSAPLPVQAVRPAYRVNPTSQTEAGMEFVPPNAEEYARQQAERAYRSPEQLEQEFYDRQVAGLQGLAANADARFADARAAQESAVGALGQRAGTLQGSAAVMAAQQAGQNAQARAATAGMAAKGQRGPGAESAILGGQIGQAQAAQLGGLEQEAAQRQAAYMRGVGALSQGLAGEAVERRAAEAELQRDMQLRFAAAQQLAAGKKEQQERNDASALSRVTGAGGAVLGFVAGGPAGGAAGYNIGSKI